MGWDGLLARNLLPLCALSDPPGRDQEPQTEARDENPDTLASYKHRSDANSRTWPNSLVNELHLSSFTHAPVVYGDADLLPCVWGTGHGVRKYSGNGAGRERDGI